MTLPWHDSLQDCSASTLLKIIDTSQPGGSHTHYTAKEELGYSTTLGDLLGLSTIFPLHGRNSDRGRRNCQNSRPHQGCRNRPVEVRNDSPRQMNGWGLHTLAIDKRLFTKSGVQNSELISPRFMCSRNTPWSTNCAHGWSHVK